MVGTGKLGERFGANIRESMGSASRPTVAGAPALPPRREVPARERGVRRETLLTIEVEQIVPDPDQPRKHFSGDAIARMADSLLAQGQIMPVAVRWSEELGKWVLIAGERRWRGAMRAGLPTLNAVERKVRLDARSILADQVAENVAREDLAPIEEATAYKALTELHGWSQRELAAAVGVSQPRVAQRLALLTLPESIQEQVQLEQIPATSGHLIAQAPTEQQESLAAQVIAGTMDREQLRERVARSRSARPGTARGKGGAKLRTERVLRNSTRVRLVATNPRGIEPTQLLAALREAVALVALEVEMSDATAVA